MIVLMFNGDDDDDIDDDDDGDDEMKCLHYFERSVHLKFNTTYIYYMYIIEDVFFVYKTH